MVLILVLYMVLAATFTLGKAALMYVSPLFFIGIRMLLGGGLLLSYLAVCKRSACLFQWKHVPLFACIIVVHIYAAYVLEFWGLQYVSSSKACLLYSLLPFITAGVSYIFLDERLTRTKWLGMLIGFVGILFALGPDTNNEQFIYPWKTAGSFAEGAILLSVIASAFGWLCMRILVRKHAYSPLWVNGIGMVGGGILALITSACLDTMPLKQPLPVGSSAWYCLVVYLFLSIIAGNIIFYNLYALLLRTYSPTFLAYAGFTCPLFATLYGNLFLAEVPTPWFFVALCLVGLGLSIFYRQELLEAGTGQ